MQKPTAVFEQLEGRQMIIFECLGDVELMRHYSLRALLGKRRPQEQKWLEA